MDKFAEMVAKRMGPFALSAATIVMAAPSRAEPILASRHDADAIAARDMRVGDCDHTRVLKLESRLSGIAARDVGSGVIFENGLTQFEYDFAPAIAASHPGERVIICLIETAENCDDASVYLTINLRTNRSWIRRKRSQTCPEYEEKERLESDKRYGLH
jgi:hypothetical protein